MDRLEQLIGFLKEIEKMKDVQRQIFYNNSNRQENDAEHSWSVAMLVLLFSKQFPAADTEKMFKLALTHDLVEIYAGDTYAYDEEGKKTKTAREAAAAKKLFGQLPPDLQEELHELFDEFEECATKEAKIVNSFDKIAPIVHNLSHNGWTWKKNNLTMAKIREYMDGAMAHDETIQSTYERLLAESKARKIL